MELPGQQNSDNLEQKRRKQKTREKVEVQYSTSETEELENIQLIHDGVENWTLFEQVDGTQIWVHDKHLVYYKDSEGGQ
ncbi:MAG: hypothetical protein ABEK04_03540 [Candidatus Nanohalobium sp.]